jgi:hypothetical protein
MDGGAFMTVADALADVGTCVTTVITTMSGNPIMMAFLGIGLVSAAAGLFAKLKGTAH